MERVRSPCFHGGEGPDDLGQGGDDRVEGRVDAFHDPAEVALVAVGVGADVQASGHRGVDQQ